MSTLSFNGKPFSDFNAFYDGSELFSIPEKDLTFYEIPGRNGDLTISNDRFKNIERSVNCFIRSDFKQNYSDLMNYLASQEGYGRIETDTIDDIFMMAQFTGNIAPNTGAFLKYGQFTISFNFKPQKWLKEGENAISISSSQTITNPTLMVAKPLIEVSGTGSIGINDSLLELAENTSTTYIDCDIEDAYEGTINRNLDLTVTNGFPRLYAGENTITVTGCTINLIPRWWRL